ncbi:hypothetical protein VTI74DRAFT_6313 [Chaetomium olivicolor]
MTYTNRSRCLGFFWVVLGPGRCCLDGRMPDTSASKTTLPVSLLLGWIPHRRKWSGFNSSRRPTMVPSKHPLILLPLQKPYRQPQSMTRRLIFTYFLFFPQSYRSRSSKKLPLSPGWFSWSPKPPTTDVSVPRPRPAEARNAAPQGAGTPSREPPGSSDLLASTDCTSEAATATSGKLTSSPITIPCS